MGSSLLLVLVAASEHVPQQPQDIPPQRRSGNLTETFSYCWLQFHWLGVKHRAQIQSQTPFKIPRHVRILLFADGGEE